MPPTGQYTIDDLLAARFQSAAEFGLDTIAEVLMRDVAAHNAIVQDMLTELCSFSTDRQRKYGTSVSGSMTEVDEHGRAPTSKVRAGATCGFPLRQFQFALGWTEKFFMQATPADMAQGMQAAQKADLMGITTEIKKAFLLSSNYTFGDFLVDKVDLDVKRLVNADGASIPDGPNGETFDGSTHTHYDAVNGLTSAKATALIQDIVEHGHGTQVRVFINRADQADWEGLTGYTAYQDPRIIFRNTDTPGRTLDLTRLDNRAIGIYDAAEIWVKPWVPASYAIAVDIGSGEKPLVFRQRANTSLQGLRIAARLSSFPLVAEYMEREFGIGVWTRTNGAVLYSGAGAYADPSL